MFLEVSTLFYNEELSEDFVESCDNLKINPSEKVGTTFKKAYFKINTIDSVQPCMDNKKGEGAKSVIFFEYDKSIYVLESPEEIMARILNAAKENTKFIHS